jgi:hypothetical protein
MADLDIAIIVPMANEQESSAEFTGATGPQGESGPVASGPTHEYVGFSSATVLAIFGFAGVADACQADFGPGSRIAPSVEVMAAANLDFPRFTRRRSLGAACRSRIGRQRSYCNWKRT